MPSLSKDLFLDESRMTRLGREPVKIEILNSISGLDYTPSKDNAIFIDIDGISIPDLENLPIPPPPSKTSKLTPEHSAKYPVKFHY